VEQLPSYKPLKSDIGNNNKKNVIRVFIEQLSVCDADKNHIELEGAQRVHMSAK